MKLLLCAAGIPGRGDQDYFQDHFEVGCEVGTIARYCHPSCQPALSRRKSAMLTDHATNLVSERTAPQESPPTTVRQSAPVTDSRPIDGLGTVPTLPNPFRHPLRAIVWIVHSLFGVASLILLLAVVAAIPVVNFLALGYLLEVEGRVARTGKLRFAFPLLDVAPKIGSIVLGGALWIVPLRLLAGAAADAALIDPQGTAAATWQRVNNIAAVVVAMHLCFALARGGSLSCFFRPIKNLRWLWPRLRDGRYWEQAEQSLRELIAALRLKHLFSLGLRGFVGAFAWLVLPTALFAAANRTEGLPIFASIIGGACLVPVFAWLPFLVARYAAQNRLRAMFELREVRQLFCKAPITWLVAVVATFVFALPLYLLKVRLPPSDAMWLVTIVFIVTSFPVKVLTGWAYHRATRKVHPAWFGFRWLARGLIIPLLALYVFLLFFTPFINEHGKAVLFEHHAFLLPVPF